MESTPPLTASRALDLPDPGTVSPSEAVCDTAQGADQILISPSILSIA